MKKNDKKLTLRVETLRNLNVDEMSQVNGGFNWACSSVFVPSSGITLLYPIITTYCD
jgi:hypothetical protein